ncbi:efflux RND transporter permease subunit [bacterium]|nr:efflux RND transporter permease subunit [bacterium]
MRFIQFSVKRRVTVSMFVGLMCLLGIIAWQQLPQEFMPSLEFSQLLVLTAYQNASSQEVETLITKVIEEACGTVKGIRRIHSVSKESISIVTVEFRWGTDMDFASLNLREKIDLVKAKLPREAKEPRIERFNPLTMPVAVISLSGDRSPQDLLKIAKRPVSELLEKVPGVAAVMLTGGLEREIKVELDQDKLANHQIPILDVSQAISKANITYPAGTVKDDTYEYVVRVKGTYDRPEEIAEVVVKVDQEQKMPSDINSRLNPHYQKEAKRDPKATTDIMVQLGTLGRVFDTVRERTSFSRYDGQENISLAILKQGDAHVVEVAKGIKNKLETIQSKLPQGIQVQMVFDQSLFIKSGIRQMLNAGFVGAFLAFLVLFFFLGNYKHALIVSASIPVSLFITLFLLHLQGITLNTISLAGLTVGIGLLVDGAIVVLENITRHRSMGKEPAIAAVAGAREMMAAVTSSIGTTLVVFLPLAFVFGLIGQVFRDLSWAVVFSQIASLVVAFTLIPMLTGQIKRHDLQYPNWLQRLAQKAALVKSGYKQFLHWSLYHPKRILLATILLWCFSILLILVIPKTLFPKLDQGQFSVQLKMPNGTKLNITDKITKQVEAVLRSIPEIEHQLVTGGSIPKEGLQPLEKHESKIVVDLKSTRKPTTVEVMQVVKGKLSQLDLRGGKTILQQGGGTWAKLGSNASPIVIEIKGHHLETLKHISETLVRQLNQQPGIYNVHSSLRMNAPEISIDVNRDQAARFSLSVADLAKTVLTAVKGSKVSEFREDGQEIDIQVRLREEDRNDFQALHRLLIHSPLNIDIPLEMVAAVQPGIGPSEILHFDQQRTVLVRAGLYKRTLDNVRPEIESLLKSQRHKHPDFSLMLTGEATQMSESFRSLCIILLMSLLLVYMIMAAQFESYWQPFLILVTIPLAVIGMGPALLLTCHSLSAMAGMGMVLLCGIVVNNGIVLIDYVNQKRRHNPQELRQILIEAGQVRLRPIVMTAMTTILGLLPLAMGLSRETKMQAPMAVVVVSGLIVSTILSLVILPTLYYLVDAKILSRLRKPAHNILVPQRGIQYE